MKLSLTVLKEKVLILLGKSKNFILHFIILYKNFKIKKLKKELLKIYKKSSSVISNTWKPLVIGIPSFLFCYYIIGSLISENISTESFAKQETQIGKPRTSEVIQLILKREIDENMWTPNLPPIFPAYILDNMPNFQIGVITAVKDSVKSLKNFAVSDEQKKILKKSFQLLSYPPNIWLLSPKSTFSVAPSSNSQYRKARKELEKITDFSITPEHLSTFLKNTAEKLRNATLKNEMQVREFSSDYVDFQADNLFYRNKGYALVMWQIAEALTIDFKQIIIAADVYTDWTLMVSNLQKAAEFKPLVIRNGAQDSFVVPNHLLIQSHYLSAARAEAEKIARILGEYFNANSD